MPPEIDEFADAFAALSTPAAAAAAETPPAEDPPKATETPPAEVKATDDTPPAENPPAETPPAEDPPAETPPAAEDPMAKVMAEMATLREPLAAVQAEKAAETKETPETPPAPAQVYTEAEADVVKKYQTDWPDVAAGEALLRRAEYQQLVAYVFDQVKKTYDTLLDLASTSSSESQYAKIVAKVPDYDEVRDKTLAWVDTQPSYLKEAYTKVANEGSPADVVDLINRFKKETGYVSAAPAAAPPAKPAAAALPEPAKRAAASLKVVNSTRTEQTEAVDPNDFDGAFAEFSKAAK
jgi:hypothetical protein